MSEKTIRRYIHSYCYEVLFDNAGSEIGPTILKLIKVTEAVIGDRDYMIPLVDSKVFLHFADNNRLKEAGELFHVLINELSYIYKSKKMNKISDKIFFFTMTKTLPVMCVQCHSMYGDNCNCYEVF